MTVSLSLLAGAGWQFFDDNGNPLSGGLLYTYEAGTTTPQATYTDSNGNVANSNPIVLDAAGRVPYQVWLTSQASYKFILKTSTSVTVWSEDDVPAEVDFATLAASSGSSLVGFLQAGAGAVARTVQSKLRDVVSVKDFGAVGDGVADDTSAIQAALTAAAANYRDLYFPSGNYRVTSNISVPRTSNVQRGYRITGEGKDYGTIITLDGAGVTTGFTFASSGAGVFQFWGEITGIKFSCVNGAARAVTFSYAHAPYIIACAFSGSAGTALQLENCNQVVVEKCFFISNGTASLAQVKLDVCTAVGWRDNYIASGNAGVVAGLDIDRTNTGVFSAGAIESTGIPVRVCEATDGTTGCQDLTFQGINAENASTSYFRLGYGWTGAGRGVKNITIVGCRGYVSGSTTVAIGVDMKSCESVSITQSQFSLSGAADCVYNLSGTTNVNILVGSQRSQYGNSHPWVKQNGSHVVVASPYYDWSSLSFSDQLAYGSKSSTTSTLDNQIFPAQGGLFNVIAITNATPTTINRTIAIPAVNGARLTLIAMDGNTTIAHLGGGGGGQFRNKSGANITLTVNQCLEYRYNGNDGNWSQVA